MNKEKLEAIKKEFINDNFLNESSRKSNENILNRLINITKREYMIELFFLDYEKIAIAILKNSGSMKYGTFSRYIKVAELFKKWCAYYGKYGEDSHKYLDRELSLKEKQEIYSKYLNSNVYTSFADLYEFLDTYFETEYDFNLWDRYDSLKLMILLLYNGILYDDIFELSVNQVYEKLNGFVINMPDKVIHVIDSETIKLLKKRISVIGYKKISKNTFLNAPISDYLITFGTSNSEMNKKIMKNTLAAFKQDHEEFKKYKNYYIYLCGTILSIKSEDVKLGKRSTENEVINKIQLYEKSEQPLSRGKLRQIKELYNIFMQD